MNCFFVTGMIITEPSSTFLRTKSSEELFMVKFCLSVANQYLNLEKKDDSAPKYNFFQCVAFGDVGKKIVECYVKGIRVSLQALIHNFLFKDSNGTPHFTDVLLVNQIECVDDSNAIFKIASKRKSINKVLVDEISSIEKEFEEVCELGFLCINENDYYNIAISNMIT